MKRSILLLSVFAIIITGIALTYQDAKSSKADTCCQNFHVQDQNGNPVAGCSIDVGACVTCSCTTNSNGDCQICNLLQGTDYTVTAHCCGTNSVTFGACNTPLVTIVVTCH